MKTKCQVRVDFSNKAFIDGLNKYAYINGCSHWLYFDKCAKLNINDRVFETKYLMSKERLRIDEQRCRNLMNEFASAE
jgi:hypothetical protein